jgi:short-subunit dehydrogenase
VSNFQDQVFLVTGASSGIGRAIADLLARRGAKVVAMARGVEALEALKAGLPHPERLVVSPGDVTVPEDIERAVASAIAAFGGLDGVVHSAGVSMRGAIAETRLEVYRQLMEINYFSTIMLAKAAMPALRARRGHFAVISSIVGYVSTPQRSGYAASKHAVQAFMDTLRLEEHAHGVHVLTVCPGFVRTNISRNALSADGSPHGRMDTMTDAGLEPEAVAEAVLDALARRKREIFPAGALERFSLVLSRVAPWLLDRILLKQAFAS